MTDPVAVAVAVEEDGPLTVDDFVWLVAEYPSSVATLAGLVADCEAREMAATVEQLAALACAAEAEGRVTIWEYEGWPCVTLEQAAASEMGLKLTRLSDRWIPEGWEEREPHGHDTPGPDGALMLSLTEYEEGHRGGGYRPGDEHRPDRRDRVRDDSMWIDPSQPEPIDVLTRREGELCRDGRKVPVYMVLGLGLQWPEATVPALVRVASGTGVLVRAVCRGCLDALRMPWNAYCAVCDRSGIDGRLPAVEPELRQGGRRRYEPGGLGGGTGSPVTPKGGDRQRSA